MVLMNLSYFEIRKLRSQHKYWLRYKTEKLVLLGPAHMSLLIDYKFFDLSGEMTSLPTNWAHCHTIKWPFIIPCTFLDQRFCYLQSSIQMCHWIFFFNNEHKVSYDFKEGENATFTKLWIVYKSGSMTYTFMIPFL